MLYRVELGMSHPRGSYENPVFFLEVENNKEAKSTVDYIVRVLKDAFVSMIAIEPVRGDNMFVICVDDYPVATASSLELAEHHKAVLQEDHRKQEAVNPCADIARRYVHFREVQHVG